LKFIGRHLDFSLLVASGRFIGSFIGIAVMEISGVAVAICFYFILRSNYASGYFTVPLISEARLKNRISNIKIKRYTKKCYRTFTRQRFANNL